MGELRECFRSGICVQEIPIAMESAWLSSKSSSYPGRCRPFDRPLSGYSSDCRRHGPDVCRFLCSFCNPLRLALLVFCHLGLDLHLPAEFMLCHSLFPGRVPLLLHRIEHSTKFSKPLGKGSVSLWPLNGSMERGTYMRIHRGDSRHVLFRSQDQLMVYHIIGQISQPVEGTSWM